MVTLPPKFHVRKGDMIKVLAGNDKGKTARILEVLPSRYSAIVEGCRMLTKHTKPDSKNPKGSTNKQEAPIHLSNLMLVEPSSGKPTRVARRRNDKGKLERYGKKSGMTIASTRS